MIGYSYTADARITRRRRRLLVKTGREFQVRSDPNQPVASVPATTKQEIVNSEIQILTSRDLIEAVINQIGADKLYPGSGWFGGASERAIDAATKLLQPISRSSPVEHADVIDVSYRNARPRCRGRRR